MTDNLMFRSPELLVGMSVAAVPDQALYDSIYQERYMGLPRKDAKGTTTDHAISYAEGLRGKLLIVHGTGDDNDAFPGRSEADPAAGDIGQAVRLHGVSRSHARHQRGSRDAVARVYAALAISGGAPFGGGQMIYNRRQILGAAAAALAVPARALAAKQEIEVQIAPVSAHTFRLTALPIREGQLTAVPDDGCLVQQTWGAPVAKLRAVAKAQTIKAGGVAINTRRSRSFVAGVQRLKLDADIRVLFQTGTRRSWAWVKAVRASTAAAISTACAADRADINCALSAARCRSRG
jgi:hypothetical protein